MSQFPSESRPLKPDDALPPVEPPSAGFILQLFVVPGVIVVIIVMVWLMFNWLAQKGNDPQAYIRDLKRNSDVRWQAAVNLANALRDPRSEETRALKLDHTTAQELATMLDAEINASSADARKEDQLVTLRIFLCRTLGEFQVADGLPALLKAADVNKEKRTDVRRAAIEAIALLTENVRGADPAHPLDPSKLSETLIAAADPEPLRSATKDDETDRPEREEAARRSAAAFALGVVGGDACLARLRSMLNDGDADVRYNAATGLARNGDAAAQDVLVEMLDPAAVEGIQAEKQEATREFKRAMIIVNALRASKQLADRNASAELRPLQDALSKLLAADMPEQVRVAAKELQEQLAGRAANTNPKR